MAISHKNLPSDVVRIEDLTNKQVRVYFDDGEFVYESRFDLYPGDIVYVDGDEDEIGVVVECSGKESLAYREDYFDDDDSWGSIRSVLSAFRPKDRNRFLYETIENENGTLEITSSLEYAHKLVVPKEICGEKVTTISKKAFKNNKRVREIELPEGLIEIRASAFEKCDKLEKINIPKTLRSIEDRAFKDCSKLARLDLPASIETIGETVFSDFLEVALDPMNEHFIHKNGYLYEKASSSLVYVTDFLSEDHDLSKDVSYVFGGALSGCAKMSRLILCKDIRIHKNVFGSKTCEFSKSLEISWIDRETGEIEEHVIIPTYSDKRNEMLTCLKKTEYGNAFSFSEYDNLHSSNDLGLNEKIEMALYRLKYPDQLTDEMKSDYFDYVMSNRKKVFDFLIRKDREDQIRYLIEYLNLDKKEIQKIIAQATRYGKIELRSALRDTY